MEVKLNLDEKQMKTFESDLSNVIKNLDDNQKLDILTQCLNNCIGDLIYNVSEGYYSTKELSCFGKELVDAISNKVTKSITTKLLKDKEVQKIIDDTIEYSKRNLEIIVRDSITEYIISNLFHDKQTLFSMMNLNYDERRNDERNNRC